MRTPSNSLEFTTHRVNEVVVDLHPEALRHIAKDADFVILRVQTFGPTGRPASRTLRIPRTSLEEPTTFGPDDPFN